MTETAREVQAPRLVHSGTYALYETPDGGRHLVYRRMAELDDEGELVSLPGQADAHLPDIPPQAIPLIENFIAHGLPPPVLAMLSGKLSPMTVMKAMRNGGEPDAG